MLTKYNTQGVIRELDGILASQDAYLSSHVDPLNEEELNWRPGEHRWNVLEVLEHLNRFGEYYIPRFNDAIRIPKSTSNSTTYRSGLFGDFAVKQIRPINGVVPNKAKSPPKTNPFLRVLDRSVIEEHKEQISRMRELLENVGSANLSKNSIPILALNFVKLNLGDSLRVSIHHAERHFVQLNNLVSKSLD